MTTTTPANRELLNVGLAQIAPVWLNREATLAKVIDHIALAAQRQCQFVTFGEALVPGFDLHRLLKVVSMQILLDRGVEACIARACTSVRTG